MPQPTASDLHIDVPLSNVSVAYLQNQKNFVAPQVFPIVPVEFQTNKYWTYTKNDWLRDEATVRADASESAGSGYNVSTGTYGCDVFAFHKDVGDQQRRNTDPSINLDTDAARFVANRLLMRMEAQWVTDFFATSIWATDSTPTNLWSNYSTSDPIDDVEGGKDGILSVTGFEANTLVLGYAVYRKLRHHPDIVDRIKYTSASTITPEMLAAVFDVERVLVAKAVKATNVEGETGAYSYMFGKHALLCYAAPAPSLLAPSAGYVFNWTGVGNGYGDIIATSRIRMDLKKADRIESEVAFDTKVVASDLGYFFNGAVA